MAGAVYKSWSAFSCRVILDIRSLTLSSVERIVLRNGNCPASWALVRNNTEVKITVRKIDIVFFILFY
jgi:hypothetical protein